MPNRSNRNQRNNNESSSIENFSKLLDEHTKALLKFSEEFKKSADAFSKNFDKTTGQDQKHRVEIAKDARDMFERESRTRSESIVQGKKVGTALIDSFKVVGRALINEFDSAVERVASKYTSQLSAITTRMQISNKEYAQMFNDASAFFQNNGLIKQFSSADFADSLTTALETGLRGEEAQRQAYQNLITNKLVPAISTNTVAYRRMSKQFGDSFNEGITAIAKYTEKVYGAEGIEEGRINSIIETLGLSTRYAAAQQGMTKEQASQMASQTTGILTAIGSTIGENFQQQIVDMLYSSSRGETLTSGQNVLAGIAGVYTAQDAMQALSDPTKLSNVIGSVLEQYSQRNPDVLGVLGNSGLGYDVSAGQEAFIALQEKSSSQVVDELNNFTQGFNASQVYQEERDKLEQGYYQDSTTALEKIFDNLSTWFASWKSNIPMFDTLVGVVKDVAKAWVGVKVYQSAGQGGIKGAFKSTFGSDIQGASQMFGEGYSFKDVAGTGIGKGKAVLGKIGIKLSSAGKVLGPVAGLALTGYDAYTGFKEGGLSQAVAKGITGAGTHASYAGTDVASALVDGLKDVAKNTAKGALIGSFAGPVGTAIGAGIGAVAGAGGALAQYFSEDNTLARATKAYAESLTELERVQTQYKDTVKKTDNSLNNLSKVSEVNGEATSEQTKAFDQLKAAYPDLLANVTDVSEMDKTYVELIKMKIEAEKKEMTETLIKQSKGTGKSAAKAAKKTASLSSTQDIAGQDLLYQISQGTLGSEALENVMKDYGLSKEEALESAHRASGAIAGHKMEIDSKGNIIVVDESTGKQISGKGYKPTSTLGDFGENRAKLESGISSTFSSLKSQYDNLKTVLESAGITSDMYGSLDNKTLKGLNIKGAKNISSILNSYNSVAESLLSLAKESPSEGLRKKYSKSGLQEIFSDLKPSDFKALISAPAFKVGLGYVPTDNFLANLHQGEMVLTSHNADMLRQLTSGSSIGSFLSGLLNISNTTASAVTDESSTDVSSVVVTAINDQTTALSGILNSILDAIHQISHKSNPASASQISEATVSFDGV